MALCSRTLASGRTIIFFSTKQRAHRAKILFGLASLPAAAELHGDMTQAARLASLEAFRRGEAAFLLATDVAARGLDILGVETVVNYDAPRELPTYLHRIGRTARAGAGGRSVTFAEDGDRALLKAVVKGTGAALAQRAVPAAAVVEWQDRVERMQDDFHDVIREEREERHLRKAEMEAQKARRRRVWKEGGKGSRFGGDCRGFDAPGRVRCPGKAGGETTGCCSASQGRRGVDWEGAVAARPGSRAGQARPAAHPGVSLLPSPRPTRRQTWWSMRPRSWRGPHAPGSSRSGRSGPRPPRRARSVGP